MSRNKLLSFCLLAFCISSGARAQTSWNDPLTNTPAIIQTDFGPFGTNLPNGGQSYCEPTSAVMSLFWLSSNGFTQLAPAVYPGQQSSVTRNLELLMAGLMDTSASGGTTDPNAQTGLTEYFEAAGLSGNFSDIYMGGTTAASIPTPAWMSQQLASNSEATPSTITFVNFSIGWFSTTNAADPDVYAAEGGHELDLLTVNSGSSVTINNAYPNVFYNVPNIPSSDPQTVGMTTLPSGLTLDGETGTDVPSQDLYQIDSPLTGIAANSLAVVGSAFAWSISSTADLATDPGFQMAPWVISSTLAINTNSATFTVQAPTTGTGGFQKQGLGTILLTNTNSLSGANIIAGGTLASTMSSGTPFGTGSITIENNSALLFEPSGSGAAIAFTLAGGTGNALTIDAGGGLLALAQGAETSLSVTIGGYTDGATPNLIRQNYGTLVIAPSGGFAALGNTEQVFVAGSGGNLPTNTFGIIAPYIVGQNDDADASGSFLSYNNANGIVQATLTPSTDLGINIATGSTVYDAVNNQAITTGGTATVGALQVEDGMSISGSNSTLEVGSQQLGDSAGIILNGGSITASWLQFGDTEGVVYSSDAGGLISSVISGSAGLTTFGPGALRLTGASVLSGTVSVNSGTLIAANSQGSATGSAAVSINSNASLIVEGAISGSIMVQEAGTLLLSGGTINNITVASIGADSSQPGGTLEGYGTVAGDADIHGTIAPGPTLGNLIFSGSSNLGGADYFWELDSLTADAGEAGIDWNLTTFTGTTRIGTSSNAVTVFVEFGSGIDDPNSTDPFWDTSHQWLLWDVTSADLVYWDESGDGNMTWNDGTFDITQEGGDNGNFYLQFVPVPEPSAVTLMVVAASLFVWNFLFFRKRKT